MAVIVFDAVRKSFRDEAAINDVSFSISAGSFQTIVGPSGSGKTTILKLILGEHIPERGAVRIFGMPLQASTLRRIGVVFQDLALYPNLSVIEHIRLGARKAASGRAAIDGLARQWLDRLQLAPHASKRPAQLSGGQRQRVAIGRALAGKPELVLLDEPFSSLDVDLRREFRRLLRSLWEEQHFTAVYITHDHEDALAMSSHILLLNRGSVVQEGSAQEIFEKPRTRFAAEFFGQPRMNVIPAALAGIDQDQGRFICVRAHQLSLSGEGELTFPATVTSSTYLGREYLIECIADGGINVVALCASPAVPGCSVLIGLNRNEVLLLD